MNDDEQVNQEQKVDLLKSLVEAQQQDLIIYVATYSNPTEKVAIEVDIYVYDNNKKSFLTGDTAKQVLSPKDKGYITISKPYMTHDEVLKDIESKYNLKKQFEEAEKSIGNDWSAIYLLYRDIEGYPYLISRPFRMKDDGDTSLGRQMFHFNGLVQI